MIDAGSDNLNFAFMYPLWHNPKALDEQINAPDKSNVMEPVNRRGKQAYLMTV